MSNGILAICVRGAHDEVERGRGVPVGVQNSIAKMNECTSLSTTTDEDPVGICLILTCSLDVKILIFRET